MSKSIGHQTANHSGVILECVVRTLERWGFRPVAYRDWKKQPTDRALLCGVPLLTPYGTIGRTEFGVVVTAPDILCRIECKSQNVSGSTDEKFPYMVQSMLMCKESEVILVYSGEHLEKSARGMAAIAYVKKEFKLAEQAGVKTTAKAFTPSEFFSWAQTKFKP